MTEKTTLSLPPRRFGWLVSECAARGIGKTVAYELAASGRIETFKIGVKRYVLIDSLDSLPERLATGENVHIRRRHGE